MPAGPQPGHFAYLLLAAIAWVGMPTCVRAAESACAASRTRSAEIEAIAGTFLTEDALFQGNTASAEDSGRPVPRMSAIDYKRAWVKFLLPKMEWRDRNAMFFTLYNRKLPLTDPEVLNVSFDVYWCLAAKGDMVLLSQGSTDHYTKIAAIDRQQQTVDLIDRWPDILMEFMGVAPTILAAPSGSGSTTGSKLVRFSRSDFERLFVAAITVDGPDEFIGSLEQALSPEELSPEVKIALGRSLLYAGEFKSFASPAADLIIDGVRSAGRAGNQNLVDQSIPAMFTAVAVAYSFDIMNGDGAAAETARQYLGSIEARYGPEAQWLDDEDALRIARFALAAKDWRTAYSFSSQVAKNSPGDYRAYLLRAQTTQQDLQAVGASGDEATVAATQGRDDAETALKLMTAREAEFDQRRRDFEQQKGVYWTRGVSAEQEDGAERDEIKAYRREASDLRDGFNVLLGSLKGTSSAGQPQQ